MRYQWNEFWGGVKDGLKSPWTLFMLGLSAFILVVQIVAGQ